MNQNKCYYCDETKGLKPVSLQKGDDFIRVSLCPKCYEKHEKGLEDTRANFRAQFGEN